MKPLLFSILFLFFYTINPFAQDRRIIFPEDKTISHEDSMGAILIDYISVDSFYSFKSPVLEACFEGNYKAFDYFVRKGYNIYDTTKDGRNALHYACFSGDIEIIKQLILKGVDKHKVNKCTYRYDQTGMPQTPFLCLLVGELKNPEAIELFIHEELKFLEDYWYFLLFSGIHNKIDFKNLYKATEILLENGISPNYSGYVRYNGGMNSLIWLTFITYLNDDDLLAFVKLFVKYNISLTYKHSNSISTFDAFNLTENREDSDCNDIYHKSSSYINAVCPYYLRWGKLRPKDPTLIPLLPCEKRKSY